MVDMPLNKDQTKPNQLTSLLDSNRIIYLFLTYCVYMCVVSGFCTIINKIKILPLTVEVWNMYLPNPSTTVE